MDVKGIKLKDELHICFLPLNHFVQVFWSLKNAFPPLFPRSNMYWYIDSALSPLCALPGPSPEPEAPKGLYPHPGIYKSVGDWQCSSTPGRKMLALLAPSSSSSCSMRNRHLSSGQWMISQLTVPSISWNLHTFRTTELCFCCFKHIQRHHPVQGSVRKLLWPD